MISVSGMADVGNDSTTLKSQYDIIQQRTQQNLALRKKKKEEKEKKAKEKSMPIATDSSIAFGIDDDLDLKVSLFSCMSKLFFHWQLFNTEY